MAARSAAAGWRWACLLSAGMALGSLLGGLTGGWIHRVYRQGIAIVLAILLWGVSVSLLGLTSVLWLAVLYLVIGGWSDLVSAVYRSTILQSPPPMRCGAGSRGCSPLVAGGPRLADLVHGLVAQATSTTVAVVGGGISTIVLTLVAAALGPSLWRYDSRHRTGGEEGSPRPIAGATNDGVLEEGPAVGGPPG